MYRHFQMFVFFCVYSSSSYFEGQHWPPEVKSRCRSSNLITILHCFLLCQTEPMFMQNYMWNLCQLLFIKVYSDECSNVSLALC